MNGTCCRIWITTNIYIYIYMKNQFSLFIFLVHKTEPENTVPTKQNSDLITNMILLNDFKWIIRV